MFFSLRLRLFLESSQKFKLIGMTVYVLQLEKGKFYVGYTARKDGERFTEHYSGKGAEWTKKYSVLQVIEIFEDAIPDFETIITLEYMRKYGWWNVRGGPWCQVNLSRPPKELTPPSPPTLAELQSKEPKKYESPKHKRKFSIDKPKLSDPIVILDDEEEDFIVRSLQAFEKQTNSKQEVEEPTKAFELNTKTGCFRCGRSSHWAKDCYAKTDQFGNKLKSPKHNNKTLSA